MKILHTVESYSPSVGGMQEVVKQISERLVRFGFDVSIATKYHPERNAKVINGVKINEFKLGGNALKYEGTGEEIDRYRSLLMSGEFDVITNFAAQQWATDHTLPLLDNIKSKKVFVPTGFSALYSKSFKMYYKQMREWIKKYDMNIFLSNDYRDINFARDNRINEDKIIIIPNGAAADEFLLEKAVNIRDRIGLTGKHFLIIHVGSHTGIKGHGEAINIFKKARLRNAALMIIGNDFGDGCKKSCDRECKKYNRSPFRFYDRNKLIVRELTRDDTVSAYREADLFLFPSNIECSPIVLFECMASRTPFLTADVGNAKEIIEWSGAGLLLPTNIDENGYSHVIIKESVQMLKNIYKNNSMRNKMMESGFAAWQSRFSWEKIAEEYANLYKGLVRK